MSASRHASGGNGHRADDRRRNLWWVRRLYKWIGITCFASRYRSTRVRVSH